MKKRVKLLTTIASLCLAVALMAFGVYAAQSAEFKVTSSVTFSVGDNVAGTATVKNYKAGTGVTTATSLTEIETKSVTFTANDPANTTDDVLTFALVALDASNPTVIFTIDYAKATGSVDATVTIDQVSIGGTTEYDTGLWKVTNGNTVLAIEYIGAADVTEAAAISFVVNIDKTV